MNAERRRVQDELLPISAIVRNNMTAAMHADEKLVKCPVGVLSTNFLTGYLEHQKVSLDLKRDVLTHFPERQGSAKVFNDRQAVQGYTRHRG